MAYSNVWTTAAPLDTQAANQGAADFRVTKLDIMQRVASFGAGLLANRPTPELTSSTANWTGVTYLATDTSQLFRWNGSSWDDISANIPSGIAKRYSNVTPNTIVDNGSPAVGISVTIPGGSLTVGSIFRAIGRVFAPSGSITPMSSISLVFNGTPAATYPASSLSPGVFSQDQYFNFVCEGACVGSSSQLGFGFASQGILGGPAGGQSYGRAFNAGASIGSSFNLYIQLDGGINSGNSIRFDYVALEIL